MRVEGSYPAPVRGVSKLEKSNRPAGYAEEQINMRADMMSSLIRRPSMRTFGYIPEKSLVNPRKVHTYNVGSDTYTLVIYQSQQAGVDVVGMKNGVEIGAVSSGPLGGYIALQYNDIRLRTIGNTTYVVNPNVVPRMTSGTISNPPYRRASHLNVISALNYGEVITLTARDQAGTTWTVSHTVPDIGDPPDYDAADKDRATAKVAAELATKLQTATPANILAAAKGSTVAVWTAPNTDWVDLEVTSGQGDRSIVAINEQIESAEGLPLYAIEGTIVQVRPNPQAAEGSYWLQAVRTGSSTAPASTWLTTVSWVESVNPTQDHEIDATTMPYKITLDETGTYPLLVSDGGWKNRRVGDTTSNKDPDFIGKPIQDLALIQSRLALLTHQGVSLSKTGESDNFFKDSAVRLLVTDRVDIGSSLAGINDLTYMVAHNGSLLVFADNAQLKLDGNIAITPQTAALSVVTRYACRLTVSPVSIGNRVLFPVSYGKSSGLMEYTAQSNTNQDTANEITQHIKGYLPGDIRLLAASTDMGIVVLQTTGTPRNHLYIADMGRPIDGEGDIYAWSKWILPEDMLVNHIYFDNKDLVVTKIAVGNAIGRFALRKDPTSLADKVHLDNRLELTSSDGINFEWPDDGSFIGIGQREIVFGEGCEFPLERANRADFTTTSTPGQPGGTVVASEDLRADGSDTCTIYIGYPFESYYTPTLPFLKDSSGRNSGDRLRISRLNLDLEETVDMQMEVNSEYYTVPQTYEFESDLLADPYSLLGQVNLYTGREAFPVGISNEQGTVTFRTDSHHGMTIAGISWLGQHHRPSRRL